MGSLGTRLRAMSLGTDLGQQAHSGSHGRGETPAKPPIQRGPVLLILDDRLQCLPWESLPALRSQRCVLAVSEAIFQMSKAGIHKTCA